jgi:microcystin-dependent protein
MSRFVSEIRAFASEIPEGWLPCDGRLLKINQYLPLYSRLGASYGGDGETTFAVPDLRGRVTAGTDARSGHEIDATSGLARAQASLIPYGVVHWAISPIGTFPSST